MVNRTVVGGNQIPMLRHTFQKRKKKKNTNLWKTERTMENRVYYGDSKILNSFLLGRL